MKASEIQELNDRLAQIEDGICVALQALIRIRAELNEKIYVESTRTVA